MGLAFSACVQSVLLLPHVLLVRRRWRRRRRRRRRIDAFAL
jgi:hypothetical protein